MFGQAWDSSEYDEEKKTWVPVDMDLSAIVLDGSGKHVDTCYFAKISTQSDNLVHSGDSKDGMYHPDNN